MIVNIVCLSSSDVNFYETLIAVYVNDKLKILMEDYHDSDAYIKGIRDVADEYGLPLSLHKLYVSETDSPKCYDLINKNIKLPESYKDLLRMLK